MRIGWAALAIASMEVLGCTISTELPVRHRTCEDPECWDSSGRGCPTDCDRVELICGDGACDEGCASCPEDCTHCGAGIYEEAAAETIAAAPTMRLELRPKWDGGWTHVASCTTGLVSGEPYIKSSIITFRAPDAPVAVDLGMDFPFFGTTYSTAWVSRDGFIAFGDPANALTSGFTLEAFDGAPRVAVAFRPLPGATVEVLTGGPPIFIWSGFTDPRTGAPAGRGAIVLRSDGSISLAWDALALDSALLGAAAMSGAGEEAMLLPEGCP